MHFVRISLLLVANKARTKGALQDYFLLILEYGMSSHNPMLFSYDAICNPMD